MARQHADDVQYRVVIGVTPPAHEDLGPEHGRRYILGPYTHEHTARAQLTSARKTWERRGWTFTGRVEVGQVLWTPLGQENDVVLITADSLAALQADEAKLAALHEWGVDNWEGYGDALSGLDPDE